MSKTLKLEEKDKDIVFSTWSKQDANLTAFSAYGKYGISILGPVNYYSLPKTTPQNQPIAKTSGDPYREAI